jgi:hypothetical protein
MTAAESQARQRPSVADRNASQKHVWRAEIVLLGTNEIMRRTAKSKTCVWRWQERFVEEGFEGFCATRRVLPGSSRSRRI